MAKEPHQPNLFILGVPRAGTTALHHRLSLHPSLCMSDPKETNYYLFDGNPLEFSGPKDAVLDRQAILDRNSYLSLFRDCNGSLYRGESSPFYFYSSSARMAIERDIQNPKLIVLFRDPIDRAYSHYLMLRRDDREDAQTFREALEREEERRRAHWAWSYAYTGLGLYSSHIGPWLNAFGRENVLMLTNEEFRHQDSEAANKVLQFLDIPYDKAFVTFNGTVNTAGIPVSRFFHQFLTYPHPVKEGLRRILGVRFAKMLGRWARRTNLIRPAYDDDLLGELQGLFRPEAADMRQYLGDRVDLWQTTLS